jgi:hypothetical protein
VIERDTLVEDLVEDLPGAVSYLIGKGIQPIACGAPIWGTIEDALRREGYGDAEIDEMVDELRQLAPRRAEESHG